MSNLVLTEKKNKIGLITLNSPATLNALNLEMIITMTNALLEWEKDPTVAQVVITSNSPKAFCAGGDVVSLYKAMMAKLPAGDFFKYEYELDLLIHKYKKPIVCLTDGLVMGGGIGIMNGCSHRIVTEKSVLAMPEISIGLFPDVGGTYFLNQMPKHLGLFFALSGSRISAGDAIYLKMADFFVESQSLPVLLEEILLGLHDIREILTKYHKKVPSDVKHKADELIQLANFEEISELDKFWRSFETTDPWIQKGINTYKKGSPTSAAVIFEQLKRGEGVSIEEAFAMELKMARQFTLHHDFAEGIRALLIDKDQNPNWDPKTVDGVSQELIEEHFKES